MNLFGPDGRPLGIDVDIVAPKAPPIMGMEQMLIDHKWRKIGPDRWERDGRFRCSYGEAVQIEAREAASRREIKRAALEGRDPPKPDPKRWAKLWQEVTGQPMESLYSPKKLEEEARAKAGKRRWFR